LSLLYWETCQFKDAIAELMRERADGRGLSISGVCLGVFQVVPSPNSQFSPFFLCLRMGKCLKS